jgi:hypothetical protein
VEEEECCRRRGERGEVLVEEGEGGVVASPLLRAVHTYHLGFRVLILGFRV